MYNERMDDIDDQMLDYYHQLELKELHLKMIVNFDTGDMDELINLLKKD